MKKAMKFLSLILALMLVVSCFAGCKDNSDSSKDEETEKTSGYVSVINKYITSINNRDAKALVSLVPDYQAGDMSKDEMEKIMEQSLDRVIESAEEKNGDNIKLSYEITDEKEYDEEELEELISDIESIYDIDPDDITKAVDVEIDLTVEGDDDTDTDSGTITIIKEKGNWKIYHDTIF